MPNRSTKRSTSKAEEAVREQVHSCTACPLRAHVIRPVPFRGPRRPHVLVIGEAPGREEAKRGRPFIGRAGRELDKMLTGAGFDLDRVAYVNTVCCLPLTKPKEFDKHPTIRAPYPDEQWACRGNWSAQVGYLRPRYGLTVGATALNLLRPDLRVTKVAGMILHRAMNRLIDPWEGEWIGRIVPIVSTYHPSWVLRSGGMKSDGGKLVMRHLRKLQRIMEVEDTYGERYEKCAQCASEEIEKCDGDGLYWCERHGVKRP